MSQSKSYRDVKAISNSSLGVYEDDFDTFVRYWVHDEPFPDKKDDSLVMGSAIDVLLTRPEEFDDTFIVYKGKTPTGQLLSFCYALFNIHDPEKELADYYQDAYNQVGFKRDTLVKVIERFQPFRSFFDFLVDSKDKAVLSLEQSAKAHIIVQELKENEYTRGIVNARSRANVDVYNQLELTSVHFYKNQVIPVKGALDKVIVNHEKKIIIPVDFKSSFNAQNFEYSYVKWRYYRQGSFYTHLLEKFMEEKGIQDYEVKKFTFVVCSTTRGKHFTYQMSQTDIDAAREGGIIQYGYRIKGWRELLDEIAYLQALGKWDYPYEAAVHNGVIPLNVFKHEEQR